MRLRFTLGLVTVLAILAAAPISPALAQEQDEDVRGAFLTTRPKTANNAKTAVYTKPNRRRPKPAASKSSAAGNVATAGSPKASAPTPAKTVAQRLGLGLTLFMRDANGLSVRVDPTREFRENDRVRFLLETNVDGYLYIFITTNGGAPVMAYPDRELDEGGNYIQSHVPFEIPSSLGAEERLRWFSFDKIAGLEKVHFVFTREPLAAVPIEDDLINYCRANDDKCPWTPGAEVWANIQKEMNQSVQVAKPQGVGKAQTDAERQAATRGLGLNRDDAEPSLILLTTSTSKDMLVAIVDLVHKSASLVIEDETTGPGVVQYEDPPE